MEKNKGFNLIIIDECHKLGAEKFSQVLNIWGDSRYFLGISATPDRNDKREKIYYKYFDEIFDVIIKNNFDFCFHFVGILSEHKKIPIL